MKKKICWILLVSILSVGASPYVSKANSLYRDKKYTQALGNYVKAQKEQPKSDLIQFNIANCLYKLDQFGHALVMYEKIIKRNPKFIRAYVNMGGIYIKLNEVGKALILYQQAHTYEPENSTIIKMLAESFLKIGDFARAIEYFEKGRAIEPANIEWYYALADIYLKLNDMNSAKNILIKAIDSENADVSLFEYIAGISMELEELDDAIYYYGEGLLRDSLNISLRYRLADAYRTAKRLVMATLTLQSCPESVWNSEVSMKIARIALELGDSEAAVVQIEKAADVGDAGARDMFLSAIQASLFNGNERDALMATNKALVYFPNDDELMGLRASMMLVPM